MENKTKEQWRLIGLKIAFYRKKGGMTQEQLAEYSKISWSYLAKIESNKGKTIHAASLKTLNSIASTLGISVTKLLDEECDI